MLLRVKIEYDVDLFLCLLLGVSFRKGHVKMYSVLRKELGCAFHIWLSESFQGEVAGVARILGACQRTFKAQPLSFHVFSR